jgi:hypothetical protein
MGALRPGLRRLRGPNQIPWARWGVRAAGRHRVSAARSFYQLAGRAAGANLTPGARARQPRTGGPMPPYSPRRRAQIAPPHSCGAGVAAPSQRRHPGAAPRPARGRFPPRRPPKTAKTGQNRPRNGLDRCPRETHGRPPARSDAPAGGQLGPFSTLVRLSSRHRPAYIYRASSARGVGVLPFGT